MAIKSIKRYLRDIKKTYPAFIPLINHFELKQKDMGNVTISTDAKYIYFNEKMVIENIKSGKELENVFAILHVLLHHTLGHTIKSGISDYMLYDLATDQKVDELTYRLLEIPIPKYTSADMHRAIKPFSKAAFKVVNEKIPIDNKRLEEIAKEKVFDIYKDSFGNYRKMKKAYKELKKKDDLIDVTMKLNKKQIASDNHSFWQGNSSEKSGEVNAISINISSEDYETLKKIVESINSTIMRNEGIDNCEEENDLEEKLADRLFIYLENQRKFGEFGANSLEASKNIMASAGETEDYREVVKSLLTQKEIHKIIPDSIDYIYYSYGLSLYGNVPLVEPKEVDETGCINNLVIAIDTSGSCDGALIEKFLREIQGLLEKVVSMGNGLAGAVHIVMCDCKLREIRKFERADIYTADFSNMEVKGFGGTDFIPVFDYIKELTDSGNKVDGLIYFTDGMGRYPEKEQEVKTVFVLEETNTSALSIPAWIQKTYFKLTY